MLGCETNQESENIALSTELLQLVGRKTLSPTLERAALDG
jgi:hypothetical protein